MWARWSSVGTFLGRPAMDCVSRSRPFQTEPATALRQTRSGRDVTSGMPVLVCRQITSVLPCMADGVPGLADYNSNWQCSAPSDIRARGPQSFRSCPFRPSASYCQQYNPDRHDACCQKPVPPWPLTEPEDADSRSKNNGAFPECRNHTQRSNCLCIKH